MEGCGLNFGSASSSCLLVGFLFSSGSYSYPSGSCRSNLINAIGLEEELGRAQSRPTSGSWINWGLNRLGNGPRPRSKVIELFP